MNSWHWHLDIRLFKSITPIGEWLSSVTGRSAFDISKVLAYLAGFVMFTGFSMNVEPTPFWIGFNIVVVFIWMAAFHSTHKSVGVLKKLAEEGRVHLDYIIYRFSGLKLTRLLLAGLVVMHFAFGFLGGMADQLITGIGYTLILFAEYLMWNWNPSSGDKLKDKLKELFTLRKPALSSTK